MFALLNGTLICPAHCIIILCGWMKEAGCGWYIYTDKRAGLPMVYLDLARF